MCQHCNHAPCETVCPVATAIDQGQNHMAITDVLVLVTVLTTVLTKCRFNWFLYNKKGEIII
jgi:molybdopterin-containing oxidoreductase family iron-sulfur binding subunit